MRNSIALLLLLCACSTPTTILKNEKTGEVATCGGGQAGSLLGGMIGYSIQKNNDVTCVNEHKAKGFDVNSVDIH